MTRKHEKLRIIPTVGEEVDKDDILRSFKDPAGKTYTGRSADKAIEKFLKKSKKQLGTGKVELRQVKKSKGAGVVRRRFEQRLNGLPIMGCMLQVVADNTRKSVIRADNKLDYDLDGAPDPADARPLADLKAAIVAPFANDFSTSKITKSKLAYLRDNNRPPIPDTDYPTASVELLSFGKKPDKRLHLVYDAQVETGDPFDVFRVVVDAVSGKVLYIELLSRYVTAKMFIYSPDPVSESDNATLSSTSTAATLNPYRHEVQAEIDPKSGGKYRLRGDWIRCNDFDSPNFAQPQENTAEFKYQTDPSDRRFLSSNAYYWLDSIARYLQTLGVTEFNNNVELIEVDAQAMNGADNSQWMGSTTPPRIRHGEGGVPDAADMAVVIHEYTHGVFDFLGSNHGGSGSYEHSVCDALPAIYRDRFNTNGHRRTEVFPWDNNANDQWSTVRRLDRTERFDDAGFAGYNFNLKNSMLGTAFWDCYIGMGGDSNNASLRIKAADAMIRTLMEMLLITPDDMSTDVTHARNMAEDCIAADTDLTGGLYSKVMDDAFIRRGLWNLRPIDLYIRDSAADTGALPSPIPHWHSPDIWVRNNPLPGDNPDLGHQNPINNQPNYLYVRVHNRGTQQATANTFSVEAFRCNPGTGMIFPDHFQSFGTLAITQAIPAGGSVRVGPFTWTPQIVDHECLLAVVHGADDPSIPATLKVSVPHGEIVRFDNNVGQRNVSPQTSVPGGKTKTSFVMRGVLQQTTNKLTLDASAMPADTKIQVRTLRRIIDGSGLTHIAVTEGGTVWTKLDMNGGIVAEIDGFALRTNDEVTVEITIDFSLQAEHLERYPLIATQEQDGAIAGRMTIEIIAVKEREDWVYGNPRSRELHVITCPFWPLISQGNKIPYETVNDGLARGYNGCAFCLPEHDTG